MLGRKVSDPLNTEAGGSEEGLNLLAVDTVMDSEKTRTVFTGIVKDADGIFTSLKGIAVEGYEIHTGVTDPYEDVCEFTSDGTGYCRGNVFGTYIHGIFDRKEILDGVLTALAGATGREIDLSATKDMKSYKEEQYELLAAGLRASLDMDRIYELLGVK